MNWVSDLLTDELWIFRYCRTLDTVELGIFRYVELCRILTTTNNLAKVNSLAWPRPALQGPVTSVTAAFSLVPRLTRAWERG